MTGPVPPEDDATGAGTTAGETGTGTTAGETSGRTAGATGAGATGATKPGYERLLVIGGAVVGILGGAFSGIIEAFYSPLMAGTVRVPLSPVLALVGNVALVWFTYRVTLRVRLALLPGLAWFAVMVLSLTGTTGTGRTTEGDVIFTGDNWMALLLIVGGSLAWGIAGGALIMSRRPVQRYGSRPLTGRTPGTGPPARTRG